MAETKRRPLVAGNWKMNGLSADGGALASAIGAAIGGGDFAHVDVLVCPPATLLAGVASSLSGAAVSVGGQDCHAAEKGAHTGDISAAMLVDAGASHVILGHSERRQDHHETDGDVLAKLRAAHAAGLVAVVCIGETLADREAGRTLEVLARQLSGSLRDADADGAPPNLSGENLVVAYEPVWAIGTGHTPTVEQVAEAHQHIRSQLSELIGAAAGAVRLLYGGSVKPSNAAELLAVPDVDGALVGGASLTADDFLGIVQGAPLG